MKTADEFNNEIAGSEELRKEFNAAYPDALDAFLKKHDYGADVKEFTAFVRAHSEGELDDDDAANAAGGYPIFQVAK